jgi:uncharacterized membrane protein
MKKVLAVLTVVSLIAIGTFAFAHGTGGWGGGHMGYGMAAICMEREVAMTRNFLMRPQT